MRQSERHWAKRDDALTLHAPHQSINPIIHQSLSSPVAALPRCEIPGLEMPQDFRLFEFGQVGRDVFLDLGADLGFQFIEELAVDFLAGGHQTTLDLFMAGKLVEPLGELPHQAPTAFQLDIVPFTVGHGAAGAIGGAGAAWKAAGQVRNLLDQFPMGLRVLEFLEQLEARAAVEVTVFEAKGFETSKISDHDQSVFHSLVSRHNGTGLAKRAHWPYNNTKGPDAEWAN
jgi:hypothetical protein